MLTFKAGLRADGPDGALMRDTRMVERKKTGRAKARKGVRFSLSFRSTDGADSCSTLGSSVEPLVTSLPFVMHQMHRQYPHLTA